MDLNDVAPVNTGHVVFTLCDHGKTSLLHLGSIQYDPTTNYQGDLSFIMSKKPATGQIA